MGLPNNTAKCTIHTVQRLDEGEAGARAHPPRASEAERLEVDRGAVQHTARLAGLRDEGGVAPVVLRG